MNLVATTPDNGDENLALGTVITLTFDEEIDLDGAKINAGIVVATSASKLANRGVGFEEINPSNRDAFNSRNFTGLVKGKLTSEDNLTVTFTPKGELEPNRTYRVLIGGGLTTRTVSDAVPDDDNTGTGNVVPKGPYTGAGETYTITITTGGALGVARYSYTKLSTGFTSTTRATDRRSAVENGLEFRFLPGTYEVGDIWVIEAYEPVGLDEILEFSFTTGNDSFEEVPTQESSISIVGSRVNGINRIDGVNSVGSTSFALLEISPEMNESNVLLTKNTIVLTFSKELDPDQIDDAFVQVLMKSLPIDTTASSSTELLVSRKIVGAKLFLTFIG